MSRKDEQRTFYDAYDARLNARNAYHYFTKRARLFDPARHAASGFRTLDIGCGDGAFLWYLKTTWSNLPMILHGVDLSPNRIEMARARLPDADFREGSADALSFSDQSMDLVFINALLHHVSDVTACLDEAIRVLVPGGTLIIVEPNRWHPLIALQAALKPVERGTFHLSARRVSAQLVQRGCTVRRVPLNSLLFPYQKLPPPCLFTIVAAAEGFLEHLRLCTHTVHVVKTARPSA